MKETKQRELRSESLSGTDDSHVEIERRSGFVGFMRSPMGRGLRIVAGLAMIYAGLMLIGGTAGVLLAVVGLVPIAAGAFNFCLLGPLFHVDLWGKERSV